VSKEENVASLTRADRTRTSTEIYPNPTPSRGSTPLVVFSRLLGFSAVLTPRPASGSFVPSSRDTGPLPLSWAGDRGASDPLHVDVLGKLPLTGAVIGARESPAIGRSSRLERWITGFELSGLSAIVWERELVDVPTLLGWCAVMGTGTGIRGVEGMIVTAGAVGVTSDGGSTGRDRSNTFEFVASAEAEAGADVSGPGVVARLLGASRPSCHAHSRTISSTSWPAASNRVSRIRPNPLHASTWGSSLVESAGSTVCSHSVMALPMPSRARRSSAISRSASLSDLIETSLSIDALAATVGRGEFALNEGGKNVRLGRAAAVEGIVEKWDGSRAGDKGEKGRLGRYEYAVAESGRFLRRSATVERIALSRPAAWARSNKP
jgi:hypothetical protein